MTGETFTVRLSGASGNTPIGDATATGTIIDDDTATGIALSVKPAAVTETGSAQTMTVTATVTGGATYPDAKTVTVSVGNTGSANEGDDFVAVDDFTLSLPAGAASGTKTFRLTPVTDEADEAGETISISGTSGSISGVTDATVTIYDTPTLSFVDPDPADSGVIVRAKEGAGALTFTVALNAASSKRVTVRYKTSNNRPVSAKAGEDYTATSGTLAFSAGQTRKTIRVPVRGDSLHEGDETFTLTLSEPTNAALPGGHRRSGSYRHHS